MLRIYLMRKEEKKLWKRKISKKRKNNNCNSQLIELNFHARKYIQYPFIQ